MTHARQVPSLDPGILLQRAPFPDPVRASTLRPAASPHRQPRIGTPDLSRTRQEEFDGRCALVRDQQIGHSVISTSASADHRMGETHTTRNPMPKLRKSGARGARFALCA